MIIIKIKKIILYFFSLDYKYLLLETILIESDRIILNHKILLIFNIVTYSRLKLNIHMLGDKNLSYLLIHNFIFYLFKKLIFYFLNYTSYLSLYFLPYAWLYLNYEK